MGQQEILDCLENSYKPLSAREISQILGETIHTVCHSLNKLVKWQEIKFVDLSREKAELILGQGTITRRAKFYYLEEIDGEAILEALLADLHSKLAE